MAVYTSNGTGGGDWSAGATWVGGVKPPSAGGHSIVIAAADTVVYDEAAGEYGNDTTTAIVVNGVLKASRAANTQLTVVGDLKTAATTVATIDWGRKTVPDALTAGTYTAKLILNKSATLSEYEFGLYIGESSNFYACGKARVANSLTTSSIAATGTSVDIDDITGWTIGDTIVLAETDGTPNHYDVATILTVTPGSGTTGTVTFAATTYGHATGCPVGNFSSTVTIEAYNAAYPAYMCSRVTSTASNNRREVDYVAFKSVGSVSGSQTKSFMFGFGQVSTPFLSFDNNSFYNGGTGNFLHFQQQNFGSWEMTNLAFFSTASARMVMTAQGTVLRISDCVFYYSTGDMINSSWSQGGQGCVYTRCKIWARAGALMSHNNGDGIKFVNCEFHSTMAEAVFYQSGSIEMTGCIFGGPSLPGTPSIKNMFNAGYVHGQVFSGIATDCIFGTPTTSFYGTNLPNAHPSSRMIIANKNIDPSIQEIYSPAGTIVRDNTSKISGVTSLKMSPTHATNTLTFTLDIPAPTGKLVGVSGKLWRDTDNVATVTLSGLGIADSVYTASGSLSADETFSVSGTNETGTDGFLTLTFSIAGVSGNMWVDAVSAPQAAAIDFGEFGFWSKGLPASVISASFVSAGDVWNYLAANISTTGSIGVFVKKLLSVAKFLGLK